MSKIEGETGNKDESLRLKHKHYSDVGGHNLRGAFARHISCAEMYLV